VQAAEISLAWPTAGRVAVDTSRVHQHLAKFSKQSSRTLPYAGNEERLSGGARPFDAFPEAP